MKTASVLPSSHPSSPSRSPAPALFEFISFPSLWISVDFLTVPLYISFVLSFCLLLYLISPSPPPLHLFVFSFLLLLLLLLLSLVCLVLMQRASC